LGYKLNHKTLLTKTIKSMLQNGGGNPTEDKKASVERFKTIVEPVLTNQGYQRLKGNSHIMYNPQHNAVVFITSCPSQTKMYSDVKHRIQKLSKQYKSTSNQPLSFYVLYTRDYSEWASKEIYITTLRRIMHIGKVVGVGIGLDNMIKFLHKVKNREHFVLGME
jgi:hypothetical protein